MGSSFCIEVESTTVLQRWTCGVNRSQAQKQELVHHGPQKWADVRGWDDELLACRYANCAMRCCHLNALLSPNRVRYLQSGEVRVSVSSCTYVYLGIFKETREAYQKLGHCCDFSSQALDFFLS